MAERITKTFVPVAIALLAVAYFAYARPRYFTSQMYLEGLLLVECLAAAIWLYRRVFFLVLVITFLLAGFDPPLGTVWTMGRWAILGVGAVVGTVIMVRERSHRFGSVHVLAAFAVLAAVVSAAVSHYTVLSFSKVLSLFFLFLYTVTGPRLAFSGREDRFMKGLLTACEIFVAAIAVAHFMGRDVLGNPNSLGAVMGVVAMPILLWGLLLKQESFAHRRRVLLCGVATYLTFSSHARAAILAAFLACGLLCLGLRRYRLLAQGIGILVIITAVSAIVQPEAFSETLSALNADVLYKGKDPTQGLLSSRKSQWDETIDTIREHFWFGTGFGTSDNGQVGSGDIGKFTTTTATSTEHGSSYLAITAWVGILGVLPFFLLLVALFRRVARTVLWMVRTGNPAHAAIPLAMVVFAGMIHAAFEDWLFAPGYYLCIFFWSMAFLLADQAPFQRWADSHVSFLWRSRAMRHEMGVAVPTR